MRSTSNAAQLGRMFFEKYVVPAIEFICAIGGQLYIYTGNVGKVHAHAALCVGVSPASNLTTNLPQSVVTTYDKIFVENLKAETPWVRTTSRRSIDENAGNRLVLYMYQNLPAPPLTQAPEGTIQTGLTATVVSNTSIMGNYADYMNISTYALQTAIDPALEALGVQMAYRMAQVINLILQNTADGAAIVDPSTLIEKAAADPMTSDDVIIAAQSLQGINALPFEAGRYTGVIHPHIVGDINFSVSVSE